MLKGCFAMLLAIGVSTLVVKDCTTGICWSNQDNSVRFSPVCLYLHDLRLGDLVLDFVLVSFHSYTLFLINFKISFKIQKPFKLSDHPHSNKFLGCQWENKFSMRIHSANIIIMCDIYAVLRVIQPFRIVYCVCTSSYI